MDNPIVSWLFETDAVRVCPEGQPFWYTSGKLGPFYINTQFLYGSEAAANALLSVIEEACAGDKLAFYGKVYGEIEKQLAACPIYHQLIDLMCEAARSMDVDFVSGGERRDFFFSMPVARRLGLGHLSIFKDLSSVYTDGNGVTRFSPLADWKHDHILAYIHYFNLPLPPIYGWKNGYLCGTHPWPARQWTGSKENGWKEVFDIDPSIVEAAAGIIPGADEFLRGIEK